MKAVGKIWGNARNITEWTNDEAFPCVMKHNADCNGHIVRRNMTSRRNLVTITININ